MIHFRSVALMLGVMLISSSAFDQNLRGLLNQDTGEHKDASPGAAPGRILLSAKNKVSVEDTAEDKASDNGLPEYLTAESLPDALSRGAGDLEEEQADENGERQLGGPHKSHKKKKNHKKKKGHDKKKKKNCHYDKKGKYQCHKKKDHHKKKKNCHYDKKGKYHCHKGKDHHHK